MELGSNIVYEEVLTLQKKSLFADPRLVLCVPENNNIEILF